MEQLLGQFWEVIVVGVGVYVMRKMIGDWLIDSMKRSDRRTTIWDHYMGIARGQGGHGGEVLDCHQEKCATL